MPQPRKPNAIKKILGNPSKEAKHKLEDCVKFNQSEMDTYAPPDLSERELEKWHELAPMLSATGVFTQGDREMLALYCRTWGRYYDAVEHVRRYGAYTTKGKERDNVASPWVDVMLKTSNSLVSILAKFGMSPVDRAKASVVQKEEVNDPKDRFFS
jgi:P27 family predicted phage terminase small subunit